MKQYKVYYGKGTLNEIDYGIYEGEDEFDAMDQVVNLDTIRNIYSRETEMNLRYEGMYAAELLTPNAQIEQNTVEKIAETEVNVKKIETTFAQLESMYAENIKELTALKTASSFGATYHYNNGETRFVPIFVLEENVIVNGEMPHKVELNFNQELLAFWMTEIKSKTIGKEHTDEEEL